MIPPTYEVNIWNFNDETVQVKLITLAAWRSALKLELKFPDMTTTNGSVAGIVRKFLSTPDDYPVEELHAHINASYEDIMDQLNISE